MPTTYYDPERAPSPAEWLALDESERIRAAQNFHVAARVKLPNVKAHALFHAIVENQVAEGFGPTCRAMERLQKEGLSRHDALHAVASVVAEFVFNASQLPTPVEASENQRKMNAALELLSAASWHTKWVAAMADLPVNTEAHGRPLPTAAPSRGRRLRLR